MNIAGKNVEIFAGQTENAPLIILHTGEDDGKQVWQAAKTLTKQDFSLAAIMIDDWDRELSPWPAPAIVKGVPSFGGDADTYLKTLTEAILPEVQNALPYPPSYWIIAGYSLAGLFAVYALYQTDRFSRAVSASGSFWYPGFCDFVQTHAPRRIPDRLYLSLGDREAKTKNPVLQTVQEHTERIFQWYERSGVPAIFELNPGNHFQDPIPRTARGIAWILKDS